MTRRSFLVSAVSALLVASTAVRAQSDHPRPIIRVAAASSLVFVLDEIDKGFKAGHPDVEVVRTLGASGALATQILNGAPFDVFLSADVEQAKRLIDADAVKGADVRNFARGRLVIWALSKDVDVTSPESVVRSPKVARIAIANPVTAPYGRAALETLNSLGLADEAKPKLVQSETVAQAVQFVESGNADAGFVPMSIVLAPSFGAKGHWAAIAPERYTPLEQTAALVGKKSPLAAAYIAYLNSPENRAVFERYGYGVP